MSQQNYRTPASVFGPLHEEFYFNVDAAASAKNALALRYYTEETDGANPEHYGPGDVVFCNPPYASAIVGRFVRCAAESQGKGARWVLLLNASTTGTRWFHRYVWDKRLHRPREGVEVRLRQGRISFEDDDGIPQTNPRYDNMVVVFHPKED